MRRTDRLFDIVQILRDGRLHRAADLGARLGVSTRTIWRDMATLAATGLPVEGERGVGYLLGAPVTLPPVALSREELEALRLGVQMAQSLGDPATARAASSLRAKIAAVTPEAARDSGPDTFVFASAEAARAAPHLGAVRRALRDHERLWLRLAPPQRPIAEHLVRPLHLEFWGKVWTLTAWDEEQADFNVFRLDLVQALEPRGGTFAPDPDKSVDRYLSRLTG